jgi:acetate kinase
VKVLVINSGSSSVKYRLFDMQAGTTLAAGAIERIGEPEGRLTHRWRTPRGHEQETVRQQFTPDHKRAFAQIGEVMDETGVLPRPGELAAIGHRVVHGGEAFSAPVLIDERVRAVIRQMTALAPLHNPGNLLGIETCRDEYPHVPQVAVFDTAFHQTMPPHAFHYALPATMYSSHHVRRYGFHGTSHQYVAKKAAGFLQRPLQSLNLITLHLGNGASATAIRAGESIDTSMGMTPMEGLVMGTRCGDLDPAISFYLSRVTGMGNDALESVLNRESGLKGVCGWNDMRTVLRRAEADEARARLAVDMYCYRIRKYIGAYAAVLGRVDALVFTAGIGENSAEIRARVCDGLTGLGIAIDSDRNRARTRQEVWPVHSAEADVGVLVVATNEELEIARQALEHVQGMRRP